MGIQTNQKAHMNTQSKPKVSGSVSVHDDEFMRLQSTRGLSECDLDLINFANELILLRD